MPAPNSAAKLRVTSGGMAGCGLGRRRQAAHGEREQNAGDREAGDARPRLHADVRLRGPGGRQGEQRETEHSEIRPLHFRRGPRRAHLSGQGQRTTSALR